MTTPLPKAQKRESPVALVVDDDAPLRARLARALGARGFAAHEAGSAQEGLDKARGLLPALVVLDLRLPGGDGLSIVGLLAALAPAPCVLLLSGYASVPVAVEAVKRGAADVLTKPADADQIVAAYERWHDSASHASPPASGGRTPYLAKTPAGRANEPGGVHRTPPTHDSQSHATPTLAQAEWNHIHRVLADCGGNITQAAEKLGLHRRSLQRKLGKRV